MTTLCEPDLHDFAALTPTMPPLWEPEDQFVGALLHMKNRHNAERAELINLVPPSTILRPITRWAYELITTLVRAGIDPDPTMVLTTARRQPPADDAVAPDLTTAALRPNILADLGRYLADIYTQSHTAGNARAYAQEILDDAFRRAAGVWGARLQQMADAYADREDITAIITDIMRGELRELWQRAEQASQPTDTTGDRP